MAIAVGGRIWIIWAFILLQASRKYADWIAIMLSVKIDFDLAHNVYSINKWQCVHFCITEYIIISKFTYMI